MSHGSWGAALLTLTLLGGIGCQKAAGPSAEEYQKQRAAMTQKQAQTTAAAPAGDQASADGDSQDASAPNYFYDPIGKRDPFRSFILDRVKDTDADAKVRWSSLT